MTAIRSYFTTPVNNGSLALFRMVFGALMLASTIRFVYRGWVSEFYIQPQYHFTYVGFEWVQPLPSAAMYGLYAALCLFSLMIMVGALYRLAIVLFFIVFTYIEFIDKTYYLNHYYFVSLLSFLLIWLPLNQRWAIDSWLRPSLRATVAPFWTVALIQLQLALVYCFAGIAKLNSDWLLRAMPLAIWLPANTDFPVVGRFFDETWMHFAMSWGGAVYDLTIPIWLLLKHTRPFAYAVVIFFHVMTALLFNIGMFPYIMIAVTLIFFAPRPQWPSSTMPRRLSSRTPFITTLLLIFFLFQVLMPLRHWLYPGDVHWTEEGYRFSWRVMLAEKAGYALFEVVDPATGRRWIEHPTTYLSPQQVHQMSFQPDMLHSFAHFLRDAYAARGIPDVEVYVEAYVSWNGRRSTLLLDPTVNLAAEPLGLLAHRDWILPPVSVED